MKVLFCGLKYEYGKPHRGLSAIEYNTFYATLKNMAGVEAEFFGMDEVILEKGRGVVDAQLIYTVEQTKPDLLFCFLFTDEIKKETIAYITKNTKTKTFNWFADDHWRFSVYSRFWAPLFTLSATTDSKAVAKYRALGINNVIKTQWAANTKAFSPQDPSRNTGEYSITFLGQNYGKRSSYLDTLKYAGLAVKAFGRGWSEGAVSQQKMLEIFSYSKINLNFTENYFSWPRQLAKLFLKKEGDKYKLNLGSFFANFQSLWGARGKQMKARIFEVPACGGFLLTGNTSGLEEFYIDGKEIVIFKDQRDLVEKCRYYLAHDSERQAIAKAGYERTIREHTYEQRFKEIFKALELM